MKPTRLRGHGLQLAADIGGDPHRTPVVLLHGGGQTRHAWGTTARAMVRAGYYVVSLDLRGHGESEWAPTYVIDSFVRDLKAVIAELPSPGPVLIGASLGGLISLLAVGESPNGLARGMVLVDITPKIEATGVARILGFMMANPEGFASLADAANAVSAYLPNRPRPPRFDGLRRNLRLRADGRYYWHWDPTLFDTLETGADDARLRRLETAATRIDIPTLLVRGQRSELVSTDSVRHFLGLIPLAEWIDVAGSGHMVAGDRNTAFTASILDFLARRIGTIG